MTQGEESVSHVPVSPLPRRTWLPLTSVGLVAVLIAGLWIAQFDWLDRALKITISGILAAIAIVLVLVWFYLFSALAWSTRWIGTAVVAFVVAGAVLAVRRVEFSGDMTPTFDFRWNADLAFVLEAHRAHQEPGAANEQNEPKPIAASDHDVLEYRGPRRDGIVYGVKLARDWTKHPPKLVWRQPVGGGYAAFVVAGPLAITIEQRRDKEAIVAYDFDTGREQWNFNYPALFSESLGGTGPRATPTIHEGRVYSLGATGVLCCVDLATGSRLWSVNMLAENGASNLDWGMAGSPLIYGNVVVVNPGTQRGTSDSRAVVAYELATGKRAWTAGGAKAGYASPMLASLAGLQQIIIFDGAGLAGFDASAPAELWRAGWKSQFDINAAQPVVVGDDRMLITSAAGAALVRTVLADTGKWTAEMVWKSNKMKSYYGCPVAYQGHVYGIDETLLTCLDLASGRQLWKARSGDYGHGQLLLCGDLLVVLAETGELALVEATPERFHELGRIQAIDGKTWNNPTLAGLRILVRNHLEMAAYDLTAEP
jgi:outer membrane protein assembly factor BamB